MTLYKHHKQHKLQILCRHTGKSRCSLSHKQVLRHNAAQTKRTCKAPPLPSLSYSMHSVLEVHVRMLQVRQVWRSGPRGQEVHWGKRSHFVLKQSRDPQWGGWWCWWGGGCSQQKGIPRMLSFNLESASHSLSLSLSLSLQLSLSNSLFFLPRLYLTSSGFPVTMRKKRRVSESQRNGLKIQSSWPWSKTTVQLRADSLSCARLSYILYVCVSVFMQPVQRRVGRRG